MVTSQAPPGQEFKLASGETVHTIEELLEYLRQSSEEDFSHHVNKDRNDFAEWIRNVHNEGDLADSVEEADSKKGAVSVLREAVKKHYAETGKGKSGAPAKPDRGTGHGEFVAKEFVYGLIFGFILGLLAAGIFNALA